MGEGAIHTSVPAGICGKFLENLRKKLPQKTTKNAAKSAEGCGTCQELTELLAENCGFGPNHEICCILRIIICVLCKYPTYRIMESTVYCMKSAEKCKKEVHKTIKKCRKSRIFQKIAGFGLNRKNWLHPWNRDFLEGQIHTYKGMIVVVNWDFVCCYCLVLVDPQQ